MSLFYTSVERLGNYILWRGYDEKGKQFFQKTKFSPKIYVESSKNNISHKYKSLYKQLPLIEKSFETMSEAKKFIENHEGVHGFNLYGMKNYISQFIAEAFPGKIHFDMNKINILSFDIETDISNGYPNMRKADKRINSISIKSSKNNTYHMLALKDYDKYKAKEDGLLDIDPENINFKKFDSEEAMLLYFIKIWVSDYPDIVTGWNVLGYDIQYIVTRIIRLLGEEKAMKLSPWGRIDPVTKKQKFGGDMYTYKIFGVPIIDYMDTFKKFGYKYGTQETYKLDHIAYVVLGESKLSYEEYSGLSELYDKNPQKYFAYNIKDTYLIQRFEEETALLALVATIAYDSGVNFIDTFGTVGIWETILYRKLKNEGIMPPLKDGVGERSEDLVGGYVKDPIPKKYRWVVSFDLNSLYPHLMLQYNMSPETVLTMSSADFIKKLIKHNKIDFSNQPDVEEYLFGDFTEDYENITDNLFGNKEQEDKRYKFSSIVSRLNSSIAANGVMFKNESLGVIPSIIKQKYAERKKVKEEMLKEESLLESIKAEMHKRGINND